MIHRVDTSNQLLLITHAFKRALHKITEYFPIFMKLVINSKCIKRYRDSVNKLLLLKMEQIKTKGQDWSAFYEIS